MAYDETLVVRLRDVLRTQDGLSEKRMFGGVAFLVGGNMSCGVLGAELIVRTSPERAEALLAEPFVRVFDMTGRPMRGWLFVGEEGLGSDEALARYARVGAAHAASLPAKAVQTVKPRPVQAAKVVRAKPAKAAKVAKAKPMKAAKMAKARQPQASAKPGKSAKTAVKAAKPARSARPKKRVNSTRRAK
jgi:hypothetical protein